MKQAEEFYCFDTVYINNAVKDHQRVSRILSRIRNTPQIVYVDDVNSLFSSQEIVHNPADRSRRLLLTDIRGEILRKCPCTHGHIPCNYYIINIYVGCPLGCSYCILQSYLSQPMNIIVVDIENVFAELDRTFRENPNHFYRIGTCESGDSLMYDALTGYSTECADFIRRYDNAMLEFKTKTTYIEPIFSVEPTPNMVYGFSLNPDIVIENEELYTARLDERINALVRLSEAGYTIALHFDPIVAVPDFEQHYGECIKRIMKNIRRDKVAWVGMGTFRYPPELKTMMDYNYPKSKLTSGEFIACEDKKFRYLLPSRVRYYRFVRETVSQYLPQVPIFMCMESGEAWQRVMGGLPKKDGELSVIFRRMHNS